MKYINRGVTRSMRGLPTKMGLIRSFSNLFEVVGIFVVVAVIVLAAAYGLSKTLTNRCDYYMNQLTPTEGIKSVCGE